MAINGQLSGLSNRANVFDPNIDTNPYITIDKAYFLVTWLIKPFKPNLATQVIFDYVMFNTHHSKTQVVVEQAFGILNERF